MSPGLDSRQRAMLAEMGIRLWQRESAATPERTHAAGADAAGAGSRVVRGAGVQHPPKAPPAAAVRPQVRAVPAAPRAASPIELAPLPEGIASMDWAALRAAVATCRACGLCAGRTQTVFGVGSQRAEWLVVGEAPGENEDRLGEPFVGQAGKLLDNMLAAIGLSRHAELDAEGAGDAAPRAPRGVYIANVVKCRPPGNRNPEPDEVATCAPYLERQVALLQPRIILAMGRFAVQSLLQTSEPIGRLRGRVHSYRGVPVVVTYHPAYLLRALPEKARAWQDLCLALDTYRQAASAAHPTETP